MPCWQAGWRILVDSCPEGAGSGCAAAFQGLPHCCLPPPRHLCRRLLGLCGGRVVYVESIARVYRLSLSGGYCVYCSVLPHLPALQSHFIHACACAHALNRGLAWSAASVQAGACVPVIKQMASCLARPPPAGKILYHLRLAHTFFVQVGRWAN
jgi:hypothetical protein